MPLAAILAVSEDAVDYQWFSNEPDLTTALAFRLPGCKSWSEWFSEVAFPAFEAKQQRIFDRNNKT